MGSLNIENVKKAFGPAKGGMVQVAITEFLLSLPLAIRMPNGIFCCHSLPTDDQIDKFDFSIFDRPLAGPDYAQRTGPVVDAGPDRCRHGRSPEGIIAHETAAGAACSRRR